MTEKITKQYFCDHCGAEIDQTSTDAIQVFIHNSPGNNIIVKPIKQLTDARRQVAIVMVNGDYCNIEHYIEHIKTLIYQERKCKGVVI